jgi:hypothetical protein
MEKYPLLVKVVKNKNDNIDTILKEMENIKNSKVNYENVEKLFFTATPSYTVSSILKFVSETGDINGIE